MSIVRVLDCFLMARVELVDGVVACAESGVVGISATPLVVVMLQEGCRGSCAQIVFGGCGRHKRVEGG